MRDGRKEGWLKIREIRRNRAKRKCEKKKQGEKKRDLSSETV